MRNTVILVISTLACLPAHGAYRVYKLKVSHYDEKGKLKKTEIVQSHLDHIQYENYYGGYRWDKVEFLDTWYCPGDTSRKKYCPKPKEPPPRGPASLDHPKRAPLPYNRQPVIP